MAAVQTSHPSVGVQYTVVDAHGNKTTVQQTAPQASGVRFLQILVGGTQLNVSQQNVTDLLTALTNFSRNGMLT